MAATAFHFAVVQLFLLWKLLIVEGKNLFLVLLALESRRLFVILISCLCKDSTLCRKRATITKLLMSCGSTICQYYQEVGSELCSNLGPLCVKTSGHIPPKQF